jgi:hypothetical protein
LVERVVDGDTVVVRLEGQLIKAGRTAHVNVTPSRKFDSMTAPWAATIRVIASLTSRPPSASVGSSGASTTPKMVEHEFLRWRPRRGFFCVYRTRPTDVSAEPGRGVSLGAEATFRRSRTSVAIPQVSC